MGHSPGATAADCAFLCTEADNAAHVWCVIETKRRKSLPLDYPEACKEWCSVHNTTLNIDEVAPFSKRTVACFVCANGHHRTVRVSLVVKGSGRCGVCSNRKLLAGFNDVGTLRPELVDEWDFEANGDVTPSDFLPQSPFRAHWICPKGHRYVVAVLRRFQEESSRCPVCVGKAALSCPACGGDIPQDWKARPKKTCSLRCHQEQYRKENPDYVQRQSQIGQERSKRNYKPTSYDRVCRECQDPFTAKRSDTVYCSPLCSRRFYAKTRRADGRVAEEKARRRALTAGVKITPGRRKDVLERDGFICQLCGLPVVPKPYPFPLAAVLDHRIALASGGPHGPENWQTAHAYCNARKLDLSTKGFHEKYPFIALMVAFKAQDLGVPIVSPTEFA